MLLFHKAPSTSGGWPYTDFFEVYQHLVSVHFGPCVHMFIQSNKISLRGAESRRIG